MLVLLVAGCTKGEPSSFSFPAGFSAAPDLHTSPQPSPQPSPQSLGPSIARFNGVEKQCLVRAMYFESIRSSASGMLAVGTVVMNRVASPRFNNSVCGVVGAPNQFAAGILTREMNEERPLALASSVADRILDGERHPGVRSAKFFHQAGLTFPFNNMTYVLEAGGNAFYIKG